MEYLPTFTIFSHKDQRKNLGKYSSPMDSMGKEETITMRNPSSTSVGHHLFRAGVFTPWPNDLMLSQVMDVIFFVGWAMKKVPGCLGDYCRGMKYYPNNIGIVI